MTDITHFSESSADTTLHTCNPALMRKQYMAMRLSLGLRTLPQQSHMSQGVIPGSSVTPGRAAGEPVGRDCIPPGAVGCAAAGSQRSLPGVPVPHPGPDAGALPAGGLAEAHRVWSGILSPDLLPGCWEQAGRASESTVRGVQVRGLPRDLWGPDGVKGWIKVQQVHSVSRGIYECVGPDLVTGNGGIPGAPCMTWTSQQGSLQSGR